jgi:hypothetical protein
MSSAGKNNTHTGWGQRMSAWLPQRASTSHKQTNRIPPKPNHMDEHATNNNNSMGVGRSDNEGGYESPQEEMDPPPITPFLRYRGFSTSMRHLFLDEPLVCAAIGGFGLCLANRTEYLLQLRQRSRGLGASAQEERSSRVMLYAYAVMFLSMFATVLFVGRVSNISTSGQNNNNYNGDDAMTYNNDDAGGRNLINGQPIRVKNKSQQQKSLQQRPFLGICKLRDVQQHIWNPIADFINDEWNRQSDTKDDPTTQQQHRHIQQYTRQQQQNIGSNICIGLLLTFLLFLGVLGRRRRMRTRFHLMRARAQEDDLYDTAQYVGGTAKRRSQRVTRELAREGACSHTLCGCYPSDEQDVLELESLYQNACNDHITTRQATVKEQPFHQDIVARGFTCCLSACCGRLCNCWFQCLSICALAQEAREMRLLLPRRYQRIDFLTHQPFGEYGKHVTMLRMGYMGRTAHVRGVLPHWQALSRLSRYLVCAGFVAVASLATTLSFHAGYSWQDAVVLAATFAQAFLVLVIVHGIFNKSDLSLDAVVKLFAAGFLIAVPTAFFLEGLLVNTFLVGAWGLFELLAATIGDSFTYYVYKHWRLVWILGEIFNAFVVAAITEELCKYYTFRAVEHPDLMFLTGLQREGLDEFAVQGGHVMYPYGSHAVSSVSSMCDERSVGSHRSLGSWRHRRQRGEELLSSYEDAAFEDAEPDVRTYKQQAMAITTGMISVAVGLACAENCLYVFVLGGANSNGGNANQKSDILEAWIVLFFRSIFPVHALAAAMQSINMIRKFVERDNEQGHRIGVGRVVLPAVILHGSFDAVLMAINVFVETAWDNYLSQNNGNVGANAPYNSLILNIVAWISIAAIMLAGLLWYFIQNRLQSQRLAELEMADGMREDTRGSAGDQKQPRSIIGGSRQNTKSATDSVREDTEIV